MRYFDFCLDLSPETWSEDIFNNFVPIRDINHTRSIVKLSGFKVCVALDVILHQNLCCTECAKRCGLFLWIEMGQFFFSLQSMGQKFFLQSFPSRKNESSCLQLSCHSGHTSTRASSNKPSLHIGF